MFKKVKERFAISTSQTTSTRRRSSRRLSSVASMNSTTNILNVNIVQRDISQLAVMLWSILRFLQEMDKHVDGCGINELEEIRDDLHLELGYFAKACKKIIPLKEGQRLNSLGNICIYLTSQVLDPNQVAFVDNLEKVKWANKQWYELVQKSMQLLQQLHGNENNNLIKHFLYDTFISHSQAEAKQVATDIKYMYASVPGIDTNRIFRDIEQKNFENKLDLPLHVYQSGMLTILLSPGYLNRAWCLVELVCAAQFAALPLQIVVPIHDQSQSTVTVPGKFKSLQQAQDDVQEKLNANVENLIKKEEWDELKEKVGILVNDVESALKIVLNEFSLGNVFTMSIGMSSEYQKRERTTCE
jgi:hypothetical protein